MYDTNSLAKHLAYEIGMIWATHNLLVGGVVEPQKDRQLDDAVLESFAVHVRNLIEFFYDGRKKADSALAEDYFADPHAGERSSERSPQTLSGLRQWHTSRSRT